MEFMALFIWVCLCLLLGGLIHFVMAGALGHRFVQVLAAPGMIVRKFSMALTALLCGATVTRVRIYELDTRDTDYKAEGVSSVAKVLVPLAPLFGGAFAVIILNAMFGHPLHFTHTPPSLASLDTGGLHGFLLGTWALLSQVVREALRADWRSLELYVLFALIFSFALGASAPLGRFKEASLGAGLEAVVLALLSSLTVRDVQAEVPASPAWFLSARNVVVGASAAAFVMMVYGMLAALVVGTAVRLYEMVFKAEKGPRGKTAKVSAEERRKEAA